MDDFLAKPLNPDLIGKILQKHAILTKDDRKPLQGHDRFPDKKNRNNQEHFDPEELLSRIQGDYTRFKVLLFDALKAIDKYLDDYHSAISQSRMESVRRYLHSIKGIALHAGFKQMVHLAQSTEHPKQNTEEKPYVHYQAMRKELQLLQDLVKQYID